MTVLAKTLSLAFALALTLSACGGNRAGTPPGGFFTGGWGGSGAGEAPVLAETDIVLSYFGEARISNSGAVKAIARDLISGYAQNDNNNFGSGIFEVTDNFSVQNPDPACTEWAFFKPSCQSKWNGFRIGNSCDPLGMNYMGGPFDCSSYNNGSGALWFELKNNGRVRIRLQFEADDYYFWSLTQKHYAMWTVDEINPDDIEVVQSFGDGVRIVLQGVAWTGSFDKIVVIEIDDTRDIRSNPAGFTNARVLYGTSSNLSVVLNTRLRLLPIL